MSGARDRTIRHMRQMLTGAAITGVALGASADDAGSPPAPTTTGSTDNSPGEGEWHMQHAKPDAGQSNNIGYGVVDPMPPPARNRGCGCHKSDPYEE
jgi:hypothetical protein